MEVKKSDQNTFRDHDLPEVAVDPDERHGMIYRQPDYSAPEPVHSPPPDSALQGHHVAAHYAVDSPMMGTEKGAQTTNETSKRRICGLSRTFFFVLLAIVLLVVLGVALGAGLGIGLKSKDTDAGSGVPTTNSTGNSTSTPLKVLASTGLASTVRGDGQGVLLYYQAPNSSLVEEFHPNDRLSSSSLAVPTGADRKIIAAPNLAPESPISAISYNLNGQVWKHIWYTDNSGNIRMTNSTGLNGSWSSADVFSFNPVRSGSAALTSCFTPSSTDMNDRDSGGASLHVFFSTPNGRLLEMYNSFNESGWTRGQVVGDVTSTSGAACGIYRQDEVRRVILFARNETSTNLMHLVRQVDPFDNWIFVGEDSVSQPVNAIADGAGMSVAANADASSVYLFYRGRGGTMKQVNMPANANGAAGTVNTWNTQVTTDTKIAAIWPSSSPEGPVVFYQTEGSQIQASVINYNGFSLANGTLGQ